MEILWPGRLMTLCLSFVPLTRSSLKRIGWPPLDCQLQLPEPRAADQNQAQLLTEEQEQGVVVRHLEAGVSTGALRQENALTATDLR